MITFKIISAKMIIKDIINNNSDITVKFILLQELVKI